LPKRRAIHVATGESTIVVSIGQTMPSFLRLAFDVRLGTFTLSVKRVEFLVEAFVCGLAGVDGTAQLAIVVGLAHHLATFLLSLKKW
jgi:hypothetical protein